MCCQVERRVKADFERQDLCKLKGRIETSPQETKVNKKYPIIYITY